MGTLMDGWLNTGLEFSHFVFNSSYLFSATTDFNGQLATITFTGFNPRDSTFVPFKTLLVRIIRAGLKASHISVFKGRRILPLSEARHLGLVIAQNNCRVPGGVSKCCQRLVSPVFCKIIEINLPDVTCRRR